MIAMRTPVRQALPVITSRPISMAAMPTAAGVARDEVRLTLREWGFPQLCDDAELIITELVANAINAVTAEADPDCVPVITIRLARTGTTVRIEVLDSSPKLPVLCEVTADDLSGRGLSIVNALTNGNWGWQPLPHGKIVWGDLAPG